MSKHKKRRNKENIKNNNVNNDLLSMLNNIDPGQISSLLENINLGDKTQYNDNDNDNSMSSTNKNTEDKTLQLLQLLKSMANAERGEVIDKLIQIYSIGKILMR